MGNRRHDMKLRCVQAKIIVAEQQFLYDAPVVQGPSGHALDDVVTATAALGQQRLVSKSSR